jgi:hypothetical protein
MLQPLKIIMCFIFSKKHESKTGIFIIEKGLFKPLDVLPKGGSINDIAESLGYSVSEFHTIFTFDNPKIQYIAFSFSKQPVFIAAKEDVFVLSYNDVIKEMAKINWGLEERTYGIKFM